MTEGRSTMRALAERLVALFLNVSTRQAKMCIALVFQYGDVSDWLATERGHFLLISFGINFDCSI